MVSVKGQNKGNLNALKFKTPEARGVMFNNFIDHLAQGFSKESFVDCDPQTVRRYLKDFSGEFDTSLMSKAERVGRLFWEKLGIDGTSGKFKGFNAKSWEFNMKNRYSGKWRDKQEVELSAKENAVINIVKTTDND